LGAGLAKRQASAISKIVGFYVETEYDIYQDKGSISAVEAFIAGLFNQVAILYFVEDIMTRVSHIYVWVSNDPYTGATLLYLLAQFKSYRTSIVGDLGILLTFRQEVGGGNSASFEGLCNSSTESKLSVAMLKPDSLFDVPTYSWCVEIVTHELGHLFGSRHTHACVWNGNNTAIDGCAGYVEEGPCSLPGYPLGGGTIMSYCQLDGRGGINLNLGFGPQPGNIIRNNVNNAVCLQQCTNNIVNYTNKTVTNEVMVNACETVNVQNVNVQSSGKLILMAPNVNISGSLNVQNGAKLTIYAK
jgi:hypothetical protein